MLVKIEIEGLHTINFLFNPSLSFMLDLKIIRYSTVKKWDIMHPSEIFFY